jgi:predicted component of type VI protein secretion system
MKINIEIDCTPEEARTCMGLPDVKPMQEAMIAEIQARIQDQLGKMDPEALMKEWVGPGLEGFQKMQKAFWDAATGGKKA